MKRRIRILAVITITVFAVLFVRIVVVFADNENEPMEEPIMLVDEDEAEVEEVSVVKNRAAEAEAKAEAERLRTQRVREQFRKKNNLVELADGGVMYLSFQDIKDNLNTWYSEEEIREVTLIVQAEDEIAFSDTIWAAHVWCILDRVGCPGFENNETIHGVLSAPNQFTTWTEENLAKTPNPDIEKIVRDVMARKVMEDAGASEETVGRTLPSHIHFFNMDGVTRYNHFYEWCWGGEYNPFDSPYNPYDN